MTDFLLQIWYGLIGLSIPTAIVYTLVTTHITIVSVTVYLHRHAAHRALELHPALKNFFRAWLWITTGMRTKEWVAIHRKHHALCETPDDPHSPKVVGLSQILFRGVEHYRVGITPETLDRYGKGTPDDWIEDNVFSRTTAGFYGLLAVNVLLFGAVGVAIWAIQMLWIPFFAAGVINGVGHAIGYRNFEIPDAATNIVPWGILIGGEELHNNHHTYPNSAKLSVKPWEFDAGWAWIKLFSFFGLAKPLSVGPVVERVEGKTTIDMDTVWGVLNDRFRVMSDYAENVVKPLAEAEMAKADRATRGAIKRAKALLCREDKWVGDRERDDIRAITESSPALATIYEMRLELTALWARRGGNGDELLRAFKSWCTEAEESGINVLRDFVSHLKSYTVPLAPQRA